MYEQKILQIQHLNRGYGSNTYKVRWSGEYLLEDILNAIDPGNYGGFAEVKKKTANVTTAIVTVYTD